MLASDGFQKRPSAAVRFPQLNLSNNGQGWMMVREVVFICKHVGAYMVLAVIDRKLNVVAGRLALQV